MFSTLLTCQCLANMKLCYWRMQVNDNFSQRTYRSPVSFPSNYRSSVPWRILLQIAKFVVRMLGYLNNSNSLFKSLGCICSNLSLFLIFVLFVAAMNGVLHTWMLRSSGFAGIRRFRIYAGRHRIPWTEATAGLRPAGRVTVTPTVGAKSPFCF